MPKLYAQPYDISAKGFYFETIEEYNQKASRNFNKIGLLVEEYEIQFIDGQDIDAELFKAIGINQSNIFDYFDACDKWNDLDKCKVIIAKVRGVYLFDIKKHCPVNIDIDIYEMDSMRDLAEYFAAQGLYGNIPTSLQFYIDYDLIARELRMEFQEITIARKRIIYRSC